jgi:hypothetical protein
MKNVADQLIATLNAAAERLGTSFAGALEGQRQCISTTMLDLSAAVDEPGFEENLIAARDSIALGAGIAATEEADAVDAELVGILTGGLSLAARALAPKL